MAEPSEIGKGHAPHAGVDVAVDVTTSGERGDVLDGIDHALGVLRCGTDHEDGVVVDRFGHRVDVGPPVVPHRHPP